MRISDWNSDVCSSDLTTHDSRLITHHLRAHLLQHAGRVHLGLELDHLAALHSEVRDACELNRLPRRSKSSEHAIVRAARRPARTDVVDIDDIGKTSCRENVGQYEYISLVARTL